jgi:hypothetical protein
MKCLKKIEIVNCGPRVVEIAMSTSETVDFLQHSNWWAKRQTMGVTEDEMKVIVSRTLGNLIAERVNLMILKDIVLQHGSKKMIEAYESYQKAALSTLKSNAGKLVGKDNDVSNRKNTKKV